MKREKKDIKGYVSKEIRKIIKGYVHISKESRKRIYRYALRSLIG
jgi:hypothetical protein